MPTTDEPKRGHIKHLLLNEPTTSLNEIAKQAGCSWKTVKRVKSKMDLGLSLRDAPRSGRPAALKGQDLELAMQELQSEHMSSSKEMCSLLRDKGIADLAPRTMRRYMRKNGMTYGTAKKGLLLSDAQKIKRVEFARKHLSLKTDWKQVMLTDSKIFCLHKAGDRMWYVRGERPYVSLPKNTTKVHVYYGVTWYGPTKPIFVTCSGSQNSQFNNAKGQQMSGVGAKEYVQDVLIDLISEGDRLFKDDRHYSKNWIFQQDGAPAHTSKEAKQVLNALKPESWMQWPPNSPDLSWIEQTWAWADNKLQRKRESLRNANDLKEAVSEILLSLPQKHCRNYIQSMQSKLQRIVRRSGETV